MLPCETRGRELPRMVKPAGGSRWNFHKLLPVSASSAVTDSSLDITYKRRPDKVGVVVSSSCRSLDQRTSPVIRLRAVSLPSAEPTYRVSRSSKGAESTEPPARHDQALRPWNRQRTQPSLVPT